MQKRFLRGIDSGVSHSLILQKISHLQSLIRKVRKSILQAIEMTSPRHSARILYDSELLLVPLIRLIHLPLSRY